MTDTLIELECTCCGELIYDVKVYDGKILCNRCYLEKIDVDND